MTGVFQQRLTEALTSKQMRPAELSRKTGIGKSSISMYMSGRHNPNASHMHKIAQALEISESWLMGYDNMVSQSIKVKSSFTFNLNIWEVSAKLKVMATSKNEAIGIVVRLIPSIAYENIIETEEDT